MSNSAEIFVAFFFGVDGGEAVPPPALADVSWLIIVRMSPRKVFMVLAMAASGAVVVGGSGFFGVMSLPASFFFVSFTRFSFLKSLLVHDGYCSASSSDDDDDPDDDDDDDDLLRLDLRFFLPFFFTDVRLFRSVRPS